MKKTMTLAPGAVIEPVGDDVMVMMPGNTDILRISDPAADTLRTIVAGLPVDPSTPTVLELADQGIIQTSGMSRRGLIRAGAIGAGAGIAVLAMPAAAAAASAEETEPQFITFVLSEGDTGPDGIILTHGGDPSKRVPPDIFPTFGTQGDWSVASGGIPLVIPVVWTSKEHGPGQISAESGAGRWVGTAPDGVDPYDYDYDTNPSGSGTLTWTFEGVTYSGPDFRSIP